MPGELTQGITNQMPVIIANIAAFFTQCIRSLTSYKSVNYL
ncbi:hypothetical protein BN1221_01006 [Brenneria goodwinii]|uniref:Uncharacterized protein n=1 Tax=Brenneria goodwinii TaxID=1109412 RepID=A0A0G4JSF0_9GAMM|nr:hypothetical protein BN1221_01006 [Brenneria goodwinii]